MFCIKSWSQNLQCGIGGHFMLRNKVTFNPFMLCNHTFQYLGIQFHMFKFYIGVVLFTITFHKAFVLTFTNFNSRFFWTHASFNSQSLDRSLPSIQSDLHITPLCLHTCYWLKWSPHCVYIRVIGGNVKKMCRSLLQFQETTAIHRPFPHTNT